MQALLEEWQRLMTVISPTSPWPALSAAEIARLQKVYDPGEWVLELFVAGWPSEPLVVAGSHRLFWSVDELMAWSVAQNDWPREWFPLGAIGESYVLFARNDEDRDSVWAVWTDGTSEARDGQLVPEGMVWRRPEGLVRATRLSLEWITDEHFATSKVGRWPLRRKELVFDSEAEAAVRETCGAFKELGPCLLPQVKGGIPEDLIAPLYQR